LESFIFASMASCRLLWLLSLLIVGAYSVKAPALKDPSVLDDVKERAARSLVAQLLKERQANTAVATSGDGKVEWVPASSLEAQEGPNSISQQEAETELREEFEESIGKDLVGVFASDIERIKKELQPTYAALPKNEYGELGHTAVRYALHRVFVATHGWHIKGIDPEGDTFNGTSPSEALKGLVPDNMQRLIEKLLYGRGFGLAEVAVLGAILENVIHQEAIAKTVAVFKAFDIECETSVSPKLVDFAIEHYMAAYILGVDVVTMTQKDLVNLVAQMPETYPGWDATRAFTRKIREDKFGNRDLSLKEIVAVVVDVGEKHGSFQQKECVDLKRDIMALEEAKNGCVPVANFYSAMANQGKWQFSESPEYLRELGALDESDPKNLKVMVPNYIDGASNCVASSSYYSVCCINEGEEILGRIEKHIQAPDAAPEDIVPLISALSSSTVPANRTLPTPLVQHLYKIATVHEGRVPIHSRLFMQWMHNAYPHESVYPHVTGTRKPRLPQVWVAEEHKEPTATKAQVDGFISQAALLHKQLHKQGQCGAWLDQEELYVPWKAHPQHKFHEQMEEHAWASTSMVALLTAIASMILMVIQVARALRASAKGRQPTKMLVA